jgi:hypothetical protein
LPRTISGGAAYGCGSAPDFDRLPLAHEQYSVLRDESSSPRSRSQRGVGLLTLAAITAVAGSQRERGEHSQQHESLAFESYGEVGHACCSWGPPTDHLGAGANGCGVAPSTKSPLERPLDDGPICRLIVSTPLRTREPGGNPGLTRNGMGELVAWPANPESEYSLGGMQGSDPVRVGRRCVISLAR